MSFQAIPFDWMRPHTTAAVRQGWSLDALLAQSRIELRHGDRRDVVSPEQAVLMCINTVLAAEDAAHGMARTGLPAKYPAMGGVLWRDFVKYCRTDAGYAALADVVGKKKKDRMESFVLAETFKYFYLLSAPAALDFDAVTFNTEAHPLRATWRAD